MRPDASSQRIRPALTTQTHTHTHDLWPRARRNWKDGQEILSIQDVRNVYVKTLASDSKKARHGPGSPLPGSAPIGALYRCRAGGSDLGGGSWGLQGWPRARQSPTSRIRAMSIDLELVSTDGSNFKWKSRGSTSCCAYDSAFLITSEGISSRPSCLAEVGQQPCTLQIRRSSHPQTPLRLT